MRNMATCSWRGCSHNGKLKSCDKSATRLHSGSLFIRTWMQPGEVPGRHNLGPLKHHAEGSWHLPLERYPLESAVPCPAKAGDVLFFSYLTIHGSGLNVSNEARTTLLVQMRDPTDLPTQQVHKSRGQGMMLRGIDPIALPKGHEET